MQTTQQDKEKNQKQVISLILLIASILLGFFITIDQGYTYIEQKDTLEMTTKEILEKKWTLEKLQEMAKSIETNVELQNDMARYAGDFREDIIIDSIFSPISGVSIASMSMSEWEKAPNGLSLANITLSLKVRDRDTLNKFLNYLTNSKINTKSYIIKSLTFPFDTTKDEPVSVSLELSMHYFK